MYNLIKNTSQDETKHSDRSTANSIGGGGGGLIPKIQTGTGTSNTHSEGKNAQHSKGESDNSYSENTISRTRTITRDNSGKNALAERHMEIDKRSAFSQDNDIPIPQIHVNPNQTYEHSKNNMENNQSTNWELGKKELKENKDAISKALKEGHNKFLKSINELEESQKLSEVKPFKDKK